MSTEFDDPRLVAVYDTLNPYLPGTQPDFYLALAREVGASRVVEIGCGTGTVTAHLARAGLDVAGLEPSALMLDVARRHPGTEGVRWIHGPVTALDGTGADLVVMPGHVAQFFLGDEEWHEALIAVRNALHPGGRLAFETRNPAARAWESWTPAATRRTVADPVAGEIEAWTEVVEVADGVVTSTLHHRFARTGDDVTATTALRFRAPEELDVSLAAAGFVVEHRYGGWDGHPFTYADEELVMVARRPAET
jgi:SAM-dependent methyltransferase